VGAALPGLAAGSAGAGAPDPASDAASFFTVLPYRAVKPSVDGSRSCDTTVIASFQPSPGAPTMLAAGTRAPSKSTWPNSVDTPLIIVSGRCPMPGWCMEITNAEMPLCRGASGSVRASSRHQSATSE
jgi:hypothetical protein